MREPIKKRADERVRERERNGDAGISRGSIWPQCLSAKVLWLQAAREWAYEPIRA